jgi:hypothetical protein
MGFFSDLGKKIRSLGKDLEDNVKRNSYLIVPESAPFNRDVQKFVGDFTGSVGGGVVARTEGGLGSTVAPAPVSILHKTEQETSPQRRSRGFKLGRLFGGRRETILTGTLGQSSQRPSVLGAG